MSVFLSDVVDLAAETIRDHPDRWTRGTYFRDERGRMLEDGADVWLDNATCACALGHMAVAADVLGHPFDPFDDVEGYVNLLDLMVVDLYDEDDVIELNDRSGRTPRQVAGALAGLADALREDGQ